VLLLGGIRGPASGSLLAAPRLSALLADYQPARRYGTKLLLEGENPDWWVPTATVKVVGEAQTGDEALRLASELSPDVAVVDPAIGEAAGDGCSATWLVMALRMAGVGRVVLFGGEEDLVGADMEKIHNDSGADATIEAGRDPVDLANAVVGTRTDQTT
jgi:DNA-binding NarL/FixJ family response regulator